MHANTVHRRQFLGTAVGVAVTTTPWLGSSANAANRPKARIKVGQIGIGHNHASGEIEPPYLLAHERMVQEALHSASGYPPK